MRTVTVRLVGAALVTRMGGSGPVTDSPHEAADILLRNEPVRIPFNRGFAQRLRWVLSSRAVAGQGPDGQGRNWQDSYSDEVGEPGQTGGAAPPGWDEIGFV